MENDIDLKRPKIITVSKLRLQVISDIHLEMRTSPPPIIVSAEVLALCGDIGQPRNENYGAFISWASQNYEHVLIVAGNHEYWDKKLSMDKIDTLIEEICNKLPNVTFLNNSTCILTDNTHKIKVFGTTLWTNVSGIPNVRRIMNDYKRITVPRDNARYPLSPIDVNIMHRRAIQALENEITDEPMIVLSHHLPSLACVRERNEYTLAYAGELDHLLKRPIFLWLCGHTHASVDMIVGRTRIISNQMGYPFEIDTGYRMALSINLLDVLSNV